ncbi:MAG TPA: hypothetical protein VFH34_11495 [Anaerolineales bacterium]|nr:hypothetical protein [Anaerolineales bacterium]
MLEDTQQVHRQLLTILERLPDDVQIETVEPAYYLVWVNGQRFPASEFFDHFHDDHEPDVRAWLAREDKQ